MILLIDHYDSFVYNLARYVRELGGETIVRRQDAITAAEVQALAPSQIILSPGPCTPAEAMSSVELVRRFGSRIPILGVCLGHQIIGAAYGAQVVRARRPMHGKVSWIRHDGCGIFAGVPLPFRAGRYNSLVIARTSLPPTLRVTATSDEDEIMAIQHTRERVVGLQFHPESVLTEYGHHLIARFLAFGANAPRAPISSVAAGSL